MRQPGAHTLVANFVVDQPGFELAARLIRQCVAQQQLLHVGRHRARTCRITLVSRRRFIESGLIAVKPRHFIAERTRELRKPQGPPIACKTRFAAVLSLQSIAAAQRSASVIPPSATCALAIGAYSSRSFG